MKKWPFLLAGILAAAFAFGAMAQTTTQFPTSPWGAYAPATVECGFLKGANFNATTDQAIPISAPSVTYEYTVIAVDNPSVSMTTAQGGFYSAASKGGVAVVASSQAYSGLTTNATNTTGNFLLMTIATAGSTTEFIETASNTLFFSLTTAQGAAATADIRVYCRPHY